MEKEVSKREQHVARSSLDADLTQNRYFVLHRDRIDYFVEKNGKMRVSMNDG